MTEEFKNLTKTVNNAVNLYKKNKPQALLELMKSNIDFNERQEETILACIKSLVQGTSQLILLNSTKLVIMMQSITPRTFFLK